MPIEKIINNANMKLYLSLDECLEFFWKAPIADIEEIGGTDEVGNELSTSIQEVMKNIKELGCWGFCDNENTIHMWSSLECKLETLIHMLAHERYHQIALPSCDNNEEKDEIIAESYGEIAEFAYKTAVAVKQMLYHIDQTNNY